MIIIFHISHNKGSPQDAHLITSMQSVYQRKERIAIYHLFSMETTRHLLLLFTVSRNFMLHNIQNIFSTHYAHDIRRNVRLNYHVTISSSSKVFTIYIATQICIQTRDEMYIHNFLLLYTKGKSNQNYIVLTKG